MGNASARGLEMIPGPGLGEGERESAFGPQPQQPPVRESWVCVCIKPNGEWIRPWMTAHGNFSAFKAPLLSSELLLIAHSRKPEAPLSSHLYLYLSPHQLLDSQTTN